MSASAVEASAAGEGVTRESDGAAAEDGRGPARLGGGARELVVARVEAGVAVEGEAAGAEDDAVPGQHRRAEAGVGHATVWML